MNVQLNAFLNFSSMHSKIMSKYLDYKMDVKSIKKIHWVVVNLLLCIHTLFTPKMPIHSTLKNSHSLQLNLIEQWKRTTKI